MSPALGCCCPHPLITRTRSLDISTRVDSRDLRGRVRCHSSCQGLVDHVSERPPHIAYLQCRGLRSESMSTWPHLQYLHGQTLCELCFHDSHIY
jgi:hypothetical protein